MEAPEDVTIGLKAIRDTLHLRWNPEARQVGERSFDVNGRPRIKEYEPRWEVWDKDVFGNEYFVMRLEAQGGGFKPAGMWVVELLRVCDPANYGGDISRMIEALVDNPNNLMEDLAHQTIEEMAESLADRFWSATTPKVSVLQRVS